MDVKADLTYLKDAIRLSGQTQADVARAMGITPQALSGLLRRTPKPETVVSVLLACNWNPGDIAMIRLGDIYKLTAARPNGSAGQNG